MDDQKIGVITEQGFAAGEGLGFNPVTEDEQSKLSDESSSDTSKKE